MVRALTPKDSSALLKILRSLKLENEVITGFASWNESKFESEVKSSLGLVWETFEIEGFILYRTIPDGYEITLLGTHPNSQKKGVMRQILTFLIESLQKDQLIWLEVHEKNAAARLFYEKLGFKITGRRPRYYADGGDCLNLEYKS